MYPCRNGFWDVFIFFLPISYCIYPCFVYIINILIFFPNLFYSSEVVWSPTYNFFGINTYWPYLKFHSCNTLHNYLFLFIVSKSSIMAHKTVSKFSICMFRKKEWTRFEKHLKKSPTHLLLIILVSITNRNYRRVSKCSNVDILNGKTMTQNTESKFKINNFF